MKIVLDTCAVLAVAFDPGQLSQDAILKMEVADQYLVCAVSIWEIALFEKQGKIRLPVPAANIVSRLKDISGLEIVVESPELWLENIALNWNHNDPVDRNVTALAMRDDAWLITKNKKIIKFYDKAFW